MDQRSVPWYVVTIGDPDGIGPELVVRSLAGGLLPRRAVICGHRKVLEETSWRLARSVDLDAVEIVEPELPLEAGSGACQVAYLERAADLVMDRGGVLVTAPISKEKAQKAGFEFPGQTEFLARRAGGVPVAMMMASPSLKVVLATTHVAIKDLPAALTQEAVQRAIVLGTRALARDFASPTLRVGVCGLNPHAGEGGRFGAEDQEVIQPAMEAARKDLEAEGLRPALDGPLAADSAFWTARQGRYDLVVAMYHDQGLAPIKTLDFHHAVNVTLGLPFVRTSPDHGTAEALVGRGTARLDSFAAALTLANRIWWNRRSEQQRRSGSTG